MRTCVKEACRAAAGAAADELTALDISTRTLWTVGARERALARPTLAVQKTHLSHGRPDVRCPKRVCGHALRRRVGRQQGLQPMSSRLWTSPPARCGRWGQENVLWRAPLSPFKRRTSHTHPCVPGVWFALRSCRFWCHLLRCTPAGALAWHCPHPSQLRGRAANIWMGSYHAAALSCRPTSAHNPPTTCVNAVGTMGLCTALLT